MDLQLIVTIIAGIVIPVFGYVITQIDKKRELLHNQVQDLSHKYTILNEHNKKQQDVNNEVHTLRDECTRLDERDKSQNDRMAKLEHDINKISEKLDTLKDDVLQAIRDIKN